MLDDYRMTAFNVTYMAYMVSLVSFYYGHFQEFLSNLSFRKGKVTEENINGHWAVIF